MFSISQDTEYSRNLCLVSVKTQNVKEFICRVSVKTKNLQETILSISQDAKY